MTVESLSASVVICTLNRPDDIQRCVEAVVSQSRKPKQLIVVDAGDIASVEGILSRQCAAANIEFICCKAKPSTTQQRNVGAERVSSDVVFFLDDDSELEANYIETILNLYELDSGCGIGGATGVLRPSPRSVGGFLSWYSKVFFLPERRTKSGSRLKASNFPIYAAQVEKAREVEIMPSTAVSYRIDVFREFLFDVELEGYVMAEDIDLSYRVSREHKLMIVPDAVYRHKKSSVSRNSVREHEKRRVLFTQYFFQKNLGHAGWRQFVRYWALFGMALRYFYIGIRDRDLQQFHGLCDGVRLASKNKLLSYRKFTAGPLEY